MMAMVVVAMVRGEAAEVAAMVVRRGDGVIEGVVVVRRSVQRKVRIAMMADMEIKMGPISEYE